MGPPPVAVVTATLDTTSDTIMMSRLDIDMPLGSIARAMLAAVALERGLDGIDEIMLSVGGCEVLETFARERASLSACDSECIATSCDLAFATMMTILQLSLDEVTFTRSTMHLNGQLDLADEDGDLVVERITGGSLSGSWTGVTSPRGRRAGGQPRGDSHHRHSLRPTPCPADYPLRAALELKERAVDAAIAALADAVSQHGARRSPRQQPRGRGRAPPRDRQRRGR